MMNANRFFVLPLLVVLSVACSTTNSGTTTTGDAGDSTANTAVVTKFADAGAMTGTWTNTTFASTGDIAVEVTFDSATGMVTVVHDVDGGVFGGTDPDPETFTIDVADFIANGTDTITVESDTYGDITLEITVDADGNGTFTLTAENVPGDNVDGATGTGSFTIDGDTITFEDGTFEIDLSAGGTASGTATAG